MCFWAPWCRFASAKSSTPVENRSAKEGNKPVFRPRRFGLLGVCRLSPASDSLACQVGFGIKRRPGARSVLALVGVECL